MQTINILCTGGTIEMAYHEPTGSLQNIKSKINPYLKYLRLPYVRAKTKRLMNVDSRKITDAGREKILAAVKNTFKHPSPVIITHGTDTMVQTGVFLKKNLKNLKVPVILTGAMTPLGFEGSDGLQNLTESLLAARILPAGVYIVIHNQVFPADKTIKDKPNARFVWKR